MITMVNHKHLRYDSNGNDVVIAKLIVTTASDLPTPTGISHFVLYETSTATDATTGEEYALTSDGTWHKQRKTFNLNY